MIPKIDEKPIITREQFSEMMTDCCSDHMQRMTSLVNAMDKILRFKYSLQSCVKGLKKSDPELFKSLHEKTQTMVDDTRKWVMEEMGLIYDIEVLDLW